VQTNENGPVPPQYAVLQAISGLNSMPAGNQPSDVLTINEVAAILRCSRNHVSNVMHGKVPGLPVLPHFVMGRRKLVRREWLSEWLQSYRTKC
jgi:Helix-turn-helix domain